MVLCRWRTPHVWLGSMRPRSQCVGGMLPVQWCYKHVLELPISLPLPNFIRMVRSRAGFQWAARYTRC